MGSISKGTGSVAYATQEYKVTQKPEVTEDIRVHRTRTLIRQAFMALTVEEGVAAVRGREINKRGLMNRWTFYRHFLDKYDLLEAYMDEMYALFEDREGERQPHEVPTNLIDLLKHIQQFADFYRAIFGATDDPFFDQRLRQKTEQRMLACFPQMHAEGVEGADAPPIDLINNVTAVAGCGAITWWLKQEQSYPPEQFAQWLYPYIYDISVSRLKLKG